VFKRYSMVCASIYKDENMFLSRGIFKMGWLLFLVGQGMRFN